jgi:hypothetical protein
LLEAHHTIVTRLNYRPQIIKNKMRFNQARLTREIDAGGISTLLASLSLARTSSTAAEVISGTAAFDDDASCDSSMCNASLC